MSERSRYRIIPGEQQRRIYGAKKTAKREAHTLVVAHVADVRQTLPAGQQHWGFDLRRGQLSIYGSLLRFIDVLYRRGVKMETALMIPAWIEAYVREVWGDAPEQAAVKIGKAA